MHALLDQHYTTTAAWNLGVRPFERFTLLGEFRFPFLMSVAVLPAHLGARDCFPALLDAGCVLVFGYYFRSADKWVGHSVVSESYGRARRHCPLCESSHTVNACPACRGAQHALCLLALYLDY